MTRNLRPFLLLLATALACGSALAQGTMRVRGTITSLDGNTLAVKSRDGRDTKLVVPDNVTVAVAQAVRFEDIKNGDYLGVTSLPGADGAAIAQELHYLAPTTAPGQSKWDLMENSTMTNANVANVVTNVGKREVTLQFKDATHRVLVPEGTPIVRSVPGARSDLKPGEYIFAAVQVAPDGTMTAPRIQVSKDGVRPPQ